MNFVPIRCAELLSRYYGQTEANIRMLFRKARAAAPCLLFFDEFDALAHKRCVRFTLLVLLSQLLLLLLLSLLLLLLLRLLLLLYISNFNSSACSMIECACADCNGYALILFDEVTA